MSDAPIDFTDHIIILGWDSLAHRITKQLVTADRKVVVISHQTDARDLVQETFSPDSVRVHLSELNDWTTFDAVNIEEAFKIFVNLEREEDSLIAILNLKALYDGLEFDVVINNPELKDTFYTAGVTYAVSPRNLSPKLTASHLLEPEAAAYTSDLLSASEKPGDHDIQQYELINGHEYVGKTWNALFWTLKDEYNCVPIGLGHPDPNTEGRLLDKMPDDDHTLHVGDHVILITDYETESDLEAFFGTSEGVGR